MALVLAAGLLCFGAWAVYRHPWRSGGSKEEYDAERFLGLTLPPDMVVFEEDPVRAARLLALPPNPKMAIADDPNWSTNADYVDKAASGEAAAEFRPPFYRVAVGVMWFRGALVFSHERFGRPGRARLVRITAGTRDTGGTRTGVVLIGGSSPAGELPRGPVRGHESTLFTIPLGASQIMRIYAGQPDARDESHFTIGYEIDDVPGTIDGWLQADDTVKLQVRDGPGASSFSPSRPGGGSGISRSTR